MITHHPDKIKVICDLLSRYPFTIPAKGLSLTGCECRTSGALAGDVGTRVTPSLLTENLAGLETD